MTATSRYPKMILWGMLVWFVALLLIMPFALLITFASDPLIASLLYLPQLLFFVFAIWYVVKHRLEMQLGLWIFSVVIGVIVTYVLQSFLVSLLLRVVKGELEEPQYLWVLFIALTPILWVCLTLWRRRAHLSRVVALPYGARGRLLVGGIALIASSVSTVGVSLDFLMGTHVGSLGDLLLPAILLITFLVQFISAITLNVIISKYLV